MGDGRIPSKLRRRVKRRAKGRCEYCAFPHAVSSGPFHCDHAIPSSRGGRASYENLVWACAWCNNFKCDRVSAVDPATRTEVRIFNPRTDGWGEHFAWSRDLLSVAGRTPVGRATVKLLRMNRRGSKFMRSAWLRAGIHPGERGGVRRDNMRGA